MASSGKNDGAGGGSLRRRSMHLFSKAGFSSLTALDTSVGEYSTDRPSLTPVDETKDKRKRLTKRNSSFGIPMLSPSIHQDEITSPIQNDILHELNSPRLRNRALSKGRPPSIFSSLGRKSFGGPEDVEYNSASPESPIDKENLLEKAMANNRTVLYHGEVQTTTGVFRKKKEYLVLTDTHLIRFKSQSRASEAFSSIPPVLGRSNTPRHPSSTSIGSVQDAQSNHSHASGDGENRIPLAQIVTAYKVEDGRPFFTTEVVYLDEDAHGVGSVQLMLQNPSDADLWQTSIRGAAQKARLMMPKPYPKRVVRYLVKILEAANDYDPNHFQVFRVVRRTTTPKASRGSSEDLQKLGTLIFYMVIGINRLHIIPVPDYSDPSGRLVGTKIGKNTFGLVSLVAMNVSHTDDRFELVFRNPLQQAKVLDLACSSAPDIAVMISKAWQYVKPQWWDYSFDFTGPRQLMEMDPTGSHIEEDEDYGAFDRTIIAYCAAYNCNPENIRYTVDWEVEDSPCFTLLPAASGRPYSLYEILAVMRSLRYNESFQSLSFTDIDLHSVHNCFDTHGHDHVAWATRSGIEIRKYFNIQSQERSLLYQEVQALALKSDRLRRMDFARSLPRRVPRDTFDVETLKSSDDPGCEIIAAVMPLCRGQITNMTWLIVSGIELGETDLDEIIPTLNEPKSQLRAIECSRCGLTDRGVMRLLSHLERQNASLECINISDNPGRVNLERFQVSMSRFGHIRKLDMSRSTRTSGEQPLITPKTLLSWNLEEFILNGIPLNDATIDSISTYLASDMSDNLRVLKMEQCSLNGLHVAILMRSMTRAPGVARELELHVSANRLEKGMNNIVKAIAENHTPAHLIIRMIEFTKEDHFRELLQALRVNTTIRTLDISKASLPADASQETCEALRQVFSENKTLVDLDISGEQAHLEVTRFGIGLYYALTGLIENTTLRTLRIEYQNLGLEGANTLSSVIEVNTGLTHIYCEHNELNLQGFTILVNALARNWTLLELPSMRDDQAESLKRMSANIRDRGSNNNVTTETTKSSMRRALSTTLGASKPVKQDVHLQDIDMVVKLLKERWDKEIARLETFLNRNRMLASRAAGYVPMGAEADSILDDAEREAMRPTTAMSDAGLLEHALNSTPKVENSDPFNESLSNLTIAPSRRTSHSGDKGFSHTSIRSSRNDDDDCDDDDEKRDVMPPASNRIGIPRINEPVLMGTGTFDFALPHITSDKLFELGDDGSSDFFTTGK